MICERGLFPVMVAALIACGGGGFTVLGDGGSGMASSGATSSGSDSSTGSGSGMSGGCAATCLTGCCAGDGSCVPSAAQDWTNCGPPGTACATCNKGALCSGSCDNTHWAPNTMLEITVTQIYAGDHCSAVGHTPEPYGQFVFGDLHQPTTVNTGACVPATTLCEPPGNQIAHVLASWLTDGKNTVDVRDFTSDYLVPANLECWGPAILAFPAPLAVSPIYTVPIVGYSMPGMTFALSAE